MGFPLKTLYALKGDFLFTKIGRIILTRVTFESRDSAGENVILGVIMAFDRKVDVAEDVTVALKL